MFRPADLIQRRIFDFEILRDMQCAALRTEAYANINDLHQRRSGINDKARAQAATKYRFVFRVPTLTGPGAFAPETEIGIDTEVTDYPINPPNTWVLSTHVPWSPHFRAGAPVCIGDEHWKNQRGHVTLGHLAVHIARMLNWDEKGRGPGYVGWNGDAIAYHRKHYHGRPLNPHLDYPSLPAWLAAGVEASQPEFQVLSGQTGPRPEFRRHR